MSIEWRGQGYLPYAYGFSYRLGRHHARGWVFEVRHPDGRTEMSDYKRSAIKARRSAFARLGKLIEEQRGAA